jgi:hypothetical protein
MGFLEKGSSNSSLGNYLGPRYGSVLMMYFLLISGEIFVFGPGKRSGQVPAVKVATDEGAPRRRGHGLLNGARRSHRQLGLEAEAAVVRVPSHRVERPETLSPVEYGNLIRALDRRTLVGKRHHALLRLMGDCGLRNSVVAASFELGAAAGRGRGA